MDKGSISKPISTFISILSLCKKPTMLKKIWHFTRGYVIRSVNTVDAMTATVEPIPYDLLGKIVSRITSEVPGINRVLYDLTPKPTGTIEWE